jgi:hypothetical protein
MMEGSKPGVRCQEGTYRPEEWNGGMMGREMTQDSIIPTFRGSNRVMIVWPKLKTEG